MDVITSQGWIVSFGGASIWFDTYAGARRFVKSSKKDIEDARRGTFKAVILRGPALAAGIGGRH